MTTTSFGTTPKSSNLLHIHHHRHYNHSRANVSFRFSNSPKLTFSSKGLHSSSNHSAVVRAQLNEVRFFHWFSLNEIHSYIVSFMENLLEPSVAFKVAVGGSSNDAATPTTLSEEVSSDANDLKLPSETSSATLLSEESISDFLSQVSSLVKLVNSTDISELQLKQLDCELLIRKKEALPQPPPPVPTYAPFIQSHSVQAVQPSTTHAHVPAPPPTPIPAPSPAAAKPSYPSLPPLKSPMAGTFYRSPAPSEPPFVKVGDKVQKGQVLCIIEAMKLMNEIEADKSGTIVETVAEDGKPVSVDTPLFVIKP